MNKTIKALTYSFGGQYLSLIIQIVSTMVISRLLTPSEVGIYSVAAGIVFIGHLLRDFGVGQYIIQEPNLTNQRIRAAYTLTIGIAWSISIFIALLAPFADSFFNDDGVSDVLSILVFSLALTPFGTITSAYLRRNMNFRPTMIAGVSSAVTGAIVTISCAFYGLSYASMAWGSLTSTIATISVMVYFRPKELPILPGFKEMSKILSFGSKLSVINITGQLPEVITEIIVGKNLSMNAVGIQSRTVGTVGILNGLLMKGLGPVVNSLFAEKARDNDDLRAPYIKGLSYVSAVAWPFFGSLVLLTEELTMVLYGENWLAVVPLIQIGCIAAFIIYLTNLTEHLLTATGNIDRMVKYNTILIPANLVLMTIAAFFSLTWIAIAGVVTAILRAILVYPHIKEIANVQLNDYKEILYQATAITAGTLLGVILGKGLMLSLAVQNDLLILLASFILGSIGWCYTIIRFENPISPDLKKLWRHLLNRNQK